MIWVTLPSSGCPIPLVFSTSILDFWYRLCPKKGVPQVHGTTKNQETIETTIYVCRASSSVRNTDNSGV
ncbi:hypothetical protein RchiOBHm_Chr4g0417321 [Rosa chinensis]|uniref:Uncharacterized protein n=1 Tax=Rosa chinensis TaxID=74649 RepID=A0A2P6QX55_ROSCH|nr:hypothetical protein RchiOBHm_Chr4g0417321 [Rosa chinensis]